VNAALETVEKMFDKTSEKVLGYKDKRKGNRISQIKHGMKSKETEKPEIF
jgi:hypothetical protein